MRFLKRFDRKIKLHLILCLQAMVVFFVIFSSSLSHAAVATAVGAGTAHSCAALATGGAKCWGGNSYGELGNSISGTSTTPVTVEGLEQYQIVAIDGGAFFTCALTSTGMVFCWGINDQRQLGTRAVASSRKPLQVQIPTGAAKALTVGSNHACVIDNYGNVYCWGTNLGGQLNRNTSIPKSETPLYAAGMNDVVAIKAYSSVTCYTDIAGGAKCFGNNKYGQLGIGVADSKDGATYGAPNYVVGLSADVTSAAGGDVYGCAVKTDGTVLCWGNNRSSMFGFSGLGTYPTPRVVPKVRNDARTITAGFSHTCIITSSGGAQCWGRNGSGQLGNGRALPEDAPSDVIGINEKITSLALGGNHTCALLESGTVKCFGSASVGELGTGTKVYSPVPVTVNLD